MANPNVETVNTSSGKLLLVVAFLLLVAGVIGFYLLAQQPAYVRAASLIGGLVLGAGVALVSAPGQSFIEFARESYREVRKVVWPTRKEDDRSGVRLRGDHGLVSVVCGQAHRVGDLLARVGLEIIG